MRTHMSFMDEDRKRLAGTTLNDDISRLSVAELHQRIADLTTEIARVEQEIVNKNSTNAAANDIFKL